MIELARARCWGRAALALLACAAGLCAQTIVPQLDSGYLRLKARQPAILQGGILERVHNGITVVVVLEAGIVPGAGAPLHSRASGRFALSYDLWEESYAVTRLGANRKSASHLSAAEAEAWCLNELPLTVRGLSPDDPFWVRLDVQPEGARDGLPRGTDVRAGLERLVEWLSQPLSGVDSRRRIEAGPFRLRDLR